MPDRLHWLLKLRRDAVYLKAERGIVFRSASADFRLNGASIYDSFTALLPFLDGTYSETALLATVRADQREKIAALLDMLVTRGIVRRIDPTDAASPDAAVARRFRAQIDFMGHVVDDPCARFGRFRQARIALLGGGTAFTAAGLALLDNGLAQLVIASDDEQAIAHPGWSAACDRLRDAGVSARVDRCAPAEIRGERFDLVLHCGDTLDGAMLQALQRLVTADRCAVLPAFVLERHGYIGPLSEPRRGGCWLCATMRWSDHAAPASATAFWRRFALAGAPPRDDGSLAGTTAQMLANDAAMEAFRFFTGVPAVEARHHLLDQDLDSLETTRHQLSRHPDCPRCRTLPVEAAEESGSTDGRDILARWSPLVGHRFATFAGFADADLEQLPLSISLLPVADGHVAGWSLDGVLPARVEVLAEAVRRRVEQGDGTGPACDPAAGEVVAPVRIGGWIGGDDRAVSCSGEVGGCWVDDGAPVRVPGPAIGPDAGWCGLGVGVGWDRATARAVSDLFEREMVESLAEGRLPLERVDLEAAPDAAIGFLLRSATLLGGDRPAIASARHASGMTMAILHPGARPTAMGDLSVCCDLSPARAVRRLLVAHVAALQLRRQNRTAVRRRRRGVFAHVPVVLPAVEQLPLAGDRRTIEREELYARLADAGVGLVAVDATPADVREAGGLRVARTLFVERGDRRATGPEPARAAAVTTG